jgi:hypothetical protein
MHQYICDICRASKKKDDRDGKWFTVATNLAGKEFRILRWPTGRNLKEPHEFLAHICDKSACLHAIVSKFEAGENI